MFITPEPGIMSTIKIRNNKIQRSKELWEGLKSYGFWLINELIKLINELIILNVVFKKILIVNSCIAAFMLKYR